MGHDGLSFGQRRAGFQRCLRSLPQHPLLTVSVLRLRRASFRRCLRRRVPIMAIAGNPTAGAAVDRASFDVGEAIGLAQFMNFKACTVLQRLHGLARCGGPQVAVPEGGGKHRSRMAGTPGPLNQNLTPDPKPLLT